jgi:hypothetical protein
MLGTHQVSLPVPEPLALLDATLLFLVQILLAKHPDLAAPPDHTPAGTPPGVRAARHILGAIREVHYALDSYRACFPDKLSHGDDTHDDIPF